MARARAWPGRVVIEPGAGAGLYVGPAGVSEVHAHHAVQLLWSAQPFAITLGRQVHQRRAVLVPANAPHGLDAGGREVALLLVEPDSALGRGLDAHARRARGSELADALIGLGSPRVAAPRQLAEETAAALGCEIPRLVRFSPVTRRALTHVATYDATQVGGMPRLADAAALAGISASRLTHVFSREVGMPFRRYVLWSRLRRAVVRLAAGADVTTAAHDAGFADGAHLSRTFRAMFGFAPTAVFAAG